MNFIETTIFNKYSCAQIILTGRPRLALGLDEQRINVFVVHLGPVDALSRDG